MIDQSANLSPTLTVVVPVYNVAPFLRDCMDSLLAQGFESFEILLVDDGSTDGSGEICDAYAAKDSRVRVIHKENGGVSSARNLALKHAQGDWITFVDSDDELFPDGLRELVGGISDEVDLVMLGILKSSEWEKGASLPHGEGRILSREEVMFSMFTGTDTCYQGYSVAKLYRRNLIEEHHLAFDPGIAIKEDTLFIVQYLCLSDKKVYVSDTPVYYYIIRESSAMESLKGSYNPKYLTSFEAIVRMNRLVGDAFPDNRQLRYISRDELMNRVYRIKDHMLVHDAMDKETVSRLNKRAFREVGIVHYLDYQFRRNWRRVARIINKVFKTHIHV